MLFRPAWSLAIVASVACCALGAEFRRPATVRPPLKVTDEQRRQLAAILEGKHAQYDPAEKMIRRPFSSPGYHTTLKGGDVHPTRDSFQYAVACLDTGDEMLRQRACDMLRRLIALQDQDPASRTYGIWSWFLEEPLSKMSPPDWNWADFCGQSLLQVALDHRDRLPADVAALVDDSIRHAARSIQKRNVGPGYTNICILGTYVTTVAAELYDLDDLRQYAAGRLKNLHEYTMRQGGFSEYNSPTYTVVSLEALAQLRQDIRDENALKLINDLYRMEWEEIAHHFHAPTRQWAGPHSRCYRTLLGTGVLALVQRATEGRVNFGRPATMSAMDELRLGQACPKDLEPFFTRLDEPRMLEKTFVKGERPVVGRTYLHPAFTLGTINRGDLWNQRRAMVAYWGTHEKPAYLHLRFLHDGYDFAAAQFFSMQQEGRAIAGINFALDGGDTHVSLDRIKNATISASYLRLRFEFGGAGRPGRLVAPQRLDDPANIALGELNLRLAVPFARWGETNGRWEAGEKGETRYLDVVLYQGEKKSINLADLSAAALAVGVEFSTRQLGTPVQASVDGGRLRIAQGGLSLQIPVKPAKAGELQRAFVAGSD